MALLPLVKKCLGWRLEATKHLFCMHWESNTNLPNGLKFILEENTSLDELWSRYQLAYDFWKSVAIFCQSVPEEFGPNSLYKWPGDKSLYCACPQKGSICADECYKVCKYQLSQNLRVEYAKSMPHQGFSQLFHAVLIWFGTSTMVQLISQKILKELIWQLLVLFTEERKKELCDCLPSLKPGSFSTLKLI